MCVSVPSNGRPLAACLGVRVWRKVGGKDVTVSSIDIYNLKWPEPPLLAYSICLFNVIPHEACVRITHRATGVCFWKKEILAERFVTALTD